MNAVDWGGITCPACGSSRFVSVSLDQGWTRLAQCVPCGAIHPTWRGDGWRRTAATGGRR